MSDLQDIEKGIGEDPENAPRVVLERPVKKSRKGRVPMAREVLVPARAEATGGTTAVPTTSPGAPPAAPAPAGAAEPTGAVGKKPRPVVESEAAPRHPKDEQSGSALARWPLVIEWMREQGYGADAVVIRLRRTQLGQFAGNTGPVEMPGGIDGAMVAGNEVTAAADMLADAVTQMYHLVGFRKGAAKYRCEFHWKNPPARLHGGSTICWGDFTLDDPEIVMEQQRRAQAFMQAQGQRASLPAAPRLPMLPSGGYAPSYPQAPPAPQGMGMQPTQTASPDPQIEALRRDLAAVLGERGVTHELRALFEQYALQPPAPPPAPVAPQLSEEDRRYIEEGRFRAMAERMGYVRQDQIQAAPVVQTPQPPPAQVVASGVSEPLSGLESLLKGFEQLEKLKPRFARLAGVPFPEEGDEPDVPEGPPAKIEDTNPFGLQEVPMSTFMGQKIMMPTKTDGIVETFQAFAMANPGVAMEGLKYVSGVLTSPAFSKFLERIVGGGGAPAQAAQQIQAQGVVGRGTHELTNGAAAAVHAAIAPLAATPLPPPPIRGPVA